MNTVTLNSSDYLRAQRLNKAELVSALYPDWTVDYALPQTWVNAMYERGLDVQPHFVWGYNDQHRFGIPLPLTLDGMYMLSVAAIGG